MAYVAQASKKTLETDLRKRAWINLFTLADMENEGYQFEGGSVWIAAVRITELEKQIYEEAGGEEFNIILQAQVILFVSMPYGKNKDNGYSRRRCGYLQTSVFNQTPVKSMDSW